MTVDEPSYHVCYAKLTKRIYSRRQRSCAFLEMVHRVFEFSLLPYNRSKSCKGACNSLAVFTLSKKEHNSFLPFDVNDFTDVILSGFGPFVWVIMAEIFPTHLKALASSMVASFCWLLSFLLTRYFDAVSAALGSTFAFGMFSVLCLVAFFFVLVQLPDTEGKSYQEIQEMLTGKKNADFSDVKA